MKIPFLAIATALLYSLCLLTSCDSWSHGGFVGRSFQPSIRQQTLIYTAIGTHFLDSTATTWLSLDSANDKLGHLLQENRTQELVGIEGYITAKRAFGSSFTFLDISTNHLDRPVQAMLKRQDYQTHNHDDSPNSSSSSSSFDGIFKSMVPGVKVEIIGCVRPTRNPGEAVLLAHQIRLLDWPRNPQHVRILLQLVLRDESLEWQEPVFQNWTKPQLEQAVEVAKTETRPSKKLQRLCQLDHLQIVAKRIVSGLEVDKDYPAEIITGASTKDTLPRATPDIETPPLELLERKRNTGAFVEQEERALSIEKAMAHLQLQDPSKPATTLQITGWIQNRRRFRNNITVLEIVDEFGSSANNDEAAAGRTRRVKAVLHPAAMDPPQSDVYGAVMAPGSQILLRGVVESSSNRTTNIPIVVLWVTHAKLLRASWRPATIRRLLDYVSTGDSILDPMEVARALQMSDTDMESLLTTKNGLEQQWEAAEISSRLQSAFSRTASISNDQLHLLGRYYQNFCEKEYPIVSTAGVSTPSAKEELSTNSEQVASRWQRKKLPQLQWMLKQVRDLCESHPDFGNRPMRILDVGGGRGLLANYLAAALDVEIHVMDIAERAVNNGQMRSKRRNLSQTVTYQAGDASAATFSPGQFDIVVALHACGALTDIALDHAVSARAAFAICPCCFQSNSHLLVRRETAVEDWLGVPATDYMSLRRMAEVQGDQPLITRATHAICALRAAAVERHSEQRISVTIKTFPIAFSTRNFALIGNLQMVS